MAKGRGKLVKHGALPQVVVVDVVTRDADGDLVGTPGGMGRGGARPGALHPHRPAPPAPPRRSHSRPWRPRPGAPVRWRRPSDDPRPVGRVMKSSTAAGPHHRRLPRRARPWRPLLPIDKKNVGRELAIPRKPSARPGMATSSPSTSSAPPASARRWRGCASGSATSSRNGRSPLIALEVTAFRTSSARTRWPRPTAPNRSASAAARTGANSPRHHRPAGHAKDHDDAVHAEPDTSGDNPGGFILTIAIRRRRGLRAAGHGAGPRGGRCAAIRLFPRPRRADAARAHLQRPVLAAPPRGPAGHGLPRRDPRRWRRKSHSFHRIMMRSAAKLAMRRPRPPSTGTPTRRPRCCWEPVLKPLWEAYAALKRARATTASRSTSTCPERKILLKPDGTVDRVVVPQRLDAHRLIEG